MKKIVSNFIVFSFISVFAVLAASAQYSATQVDADIPFDFSIGKKTFKAGKYHLKLLRNNSGGYNVTLRDESQKMIFSTIALRNASTKLKGSDMVFAVVDGHRYLEKIRTPEVGYGFYTSFSDKRSASIERAAVPVSGAPQL